MPRAQPGIDGAAGAASNEGKPFGTNPPAPAVDGGASQSSAPPAGKERSLTEVEILSLARFLMSQNKPDEAEKIYRLLLKSSPSEEVRIEAAFQIGLALVQRGKHREAATYFIAILHRRPDLPRVRLELARAYFLDRNYPDAAFQFELVKGGKLPPEVLANVDAFLDLIRRQKNWTFSFAASPVSDSNLSQASGEREECLNYLGLVLCRPLDEKTSGIGLNLSASLDYFKRLSQNWGLRASAGFYGLEYKGRRFDDYSFVAALGPRTLWASGEASLQPMFRKRWYAGKPYRDELGLWLEGRQILGRFILHGGASHAKVDYADEYVQSLLYGTHWGVWLQPRYIVNDRTFVQVGLSFLREDTREAAYANDNWSYSLGAYRALPLGFSLFVEVSLTRSKYKAPQPYASQDMRWLSAVRKDETLGFATSLSSNRLEKYNLTPTLRYSHVRRDSNIWSREFRRNRLDFLMNLRI